MLEPQAAAGRIDKEKIGVGESAQGPLVGRMAAGGDQRAIGYDSADDGRRAHDFRLLLRQTPQARRHQGAYPAAATARRQRLRQFLGGREMAQFLDVERHAAGIVVDARDQERIGLRQPASHRARGLRAVERLEFDVRGAGDKVHIVIVRAAGQDDAQRRIRLQKRGQQLPRGVVRPLPVVDDERDAARPCERQHEGRYVVDGAARRLRGPDIRAGGDEPADGIDARTEFVAPRLQRIARQRDGLFRQYAVAKSDEGAQRLQEWLEDFRAEIVLAPAAQDGEGGSVDRLQDLLEQPRLAQPRPAENDRGARRGFAAEQEVAQRLDDRTAADERRKAAAGGGFETPCCGAAAQDDVGRQFEPGGRHLDGRAQLEEVRARTKRVGAGDDLARRSALRQARGHIGHVANKVEHALLDIAGGDERRAGMYAGMHAQGHKTRRQANGPQLTDPFVNLQRGVGGATAVVLAGLGMAEHDGRAVALHSGDDAAAPDRGGAADFAQLMKEGREFLGLHFPPERRRADEVREQDRQSTARAEVLSGWFLGAHLVLAWTLSLCSLDLPLKVRETQCYATKRPPPTLIRSLERRFSAPRRLHCRSARRRMGHASGLRKGKQDCAIECRARVATVGIQRSLAPILEIFQLNS
ncbi:MAG: hypothetical protein V9G24_12780 [Rhodoblastus sp.]